MSNTQSSAVGRARPKVMCVDDEPAVLEGLSFVLRRRYDVLTAVGPSMAIRLLTDHPDVEVIVSDMRMPGMDGAAFLSHARAVVPAAVRLLLTGDADVMAAASAVNDGQIFRFLTKPCPPATLIAAIDAAIEQHRLATAERVLTEGTLRGSVTAIVDVLALVNPLAFGRASRMKQLVTQLAATLALPPSWELEVAAMLSQLGMITLPPETLAKVYHGAAMTDAERAMVDRVPALTQRLLSAIPRLETVCAIIAGHFRQTSQVTAGGVAGPDLYADLLRAAADFDVLDMQGNSGPLIVGAMRSRAGRCAPAVLDALGRLQDIRGQQNVRELDVSLLQVGMIFAENVYVTTGMLLAGRGYPVTAGFVERLHNFRDTLVSRTVRVIVADAEAGHRVP